MPQTKLSKVLQVCLTVNTHHLLKQVGTHFLITEVRNNSDSSQIIQIFFFFGKGVWWNFTKLKKKSVCGGYCNRVNNMVCVVYCMGRRTCKGMNMGTHSFELVGNTAETLQFPFFFIPCPSPLAFFILIFTQQNLSTA